MSGHLTNDYVQEQADASLGGDLTLAIRLNRSRSGFVAAINASAYGIPVGGDSCLLAPDGGCILEQPAFTLLGALAGWESPGSRVRAMGGLGFALPQWTDQPSLGIQARVDAAIPVIQYVSLIGSVRGALVPNHHHATYGLMALGIGLRLRTG